MRLRWEEVSTGSPVDIHKELTRLGVLRKQPKARKPGNRANNYVNTMAAFDIETSRIDLPIPKGEKQNSHAFMYIWQFQIGEDLTIIGRYWDDFKKLIELLCHKLYDISEEFHMDEIPHLVCWVHNLAHEWAFLSGIYDFQYNEAFFREPRKPIYCSMYGCIEFRCSYMQTNMSLAALTKRYGVEQKLSGQKFDYNKIRYPWTELTEYELDYCCIDVSSLVKVMAIRMAQDGDNVQTIPLTSTGYVRRDVKAALKPLYMEIRDILPTEEAYRLLRDAFRGGNTHCNRAYSGRIMENVYSYDMASCYPAMLLTKKYPVGKWRFLDDRLSLDRIMKFLGLNYAVVARYVFTNIRLKNPREPIPYLSLSRTQSTGHMKIDNGRILYADICSCALTEYDLDIVLKQYEYDEISVLTAMVSQKGYLPEEYKNVIRKYYHDKTALKGLEGKTPEETLEILYTYQKSKERINAIFGMTCQSALNSDVFYINGTYIVLDYELRKHKVPELLEKLKRGGVDSESLSKALDKAQDIDATLLKAKFPYSWGVYTTSLARAALQEGIDLAGEQMYYCDTDSIKTVGPVDIEKLNAPRRKLAQRYKGVEKDVKGNPHYIGIFEYEQTYDRFISCGAKRYAYEIDGHMSITVSGVQSKIINEATGVPYAVEELGALENFREGFTWKKAGGVLAVYNDNDDFDYTDPATGRAVHIGKNVALCPSTYTMTYEKDYKALLEELKLYGEYIDERK